MLKFAKLFLAILLFAACSSEPEPKPTTPLIIKAANGDIRFMVEVANTPQDLQTGLMHRTNLGFNSGMIFNIYPVRPTAMWMKNTKIPLDMLFIGPDTSIIMIKENAAPMSEEQIICKEPVRAVIEINAGQVKRHGIKVGDKVVHAILNSMVDIKSPGPEAQTKPTAVSNTSKADIPVPTLKVEAKTPQPASTVNTSAPKTTAAPVANLPAATPKMPVPAPNL
ncbi:MAG: DUF192 domain-containing protein [Alphaproteobacteria bacterium]|nr:DUF192 domain-containing protein [Alphaproteobacteria bacterium]